MNLKTRQEYYIFGGALIGFLVLGLGANERRYALGESYFREQFHLPEGAEFVELPRPRHGLPSRAVVEFSEADWRSFVASLNDPARVTPFLFKFPADHERHAQIARWQDMPPVMTAEEAPKHIPDIPRIYDFAWDYRVQNGRILCIVYVAETPAGARSCYGSTKDDPLYSFVLGVLDFDRMQLHLRFKGDTGAWV